MKRRIALHAGLFAAMITTAACGENVNAVPTGPTGPSSLSSFFLPRLDGLWGGSATLTSITGGTGPAANAGALDCAGTTLGAALGESNEHTLSIIQDGTNISAKLTSAATGLTCTYTGRIGAANSFVLSADASSCSAPTVYLRCQPDQNGNVAVRQLDLVASSITATFDGPVNATSITGTAAHTYNVLGNVDVTKDDFSATPIGTVVANHFVALSRR